MFFQQSTNNAFDFFFDRFDFVCVHTSLNPITVMLGKSRPRTTMDPTRPRIRAMNPVTHIGLPCMSIKPFCCGALVNMVTAVFEGVTTVNLNGSSEQVWWLQLVVVQYSIYITTAFTMTCMLILSIMSRCGQWERRYNS